MSRWRILYILIIGFACQMVTGIMHAAEQNTEFSIKPREPVADVIRGEYATEVKRHIDALFAICFPEERQKAEKRLVDILSPPERFGYPFSTWSAPANFLSPPHRRLLIVEFHSGTGHYVDLWVLHELDDSVKSFRFKGSEKGCGHWQALNDLDADGDSEIVVKNFVGEYEGASTIAVWPAVYKWNGENYVRADETFPDFYAQQVVPKYEKILAEIKDWENHQDERPRRVYRKCRFILERARSIAKKSKSVQ
jgi:hypothetical protein